MAYNAGITVNENQRDNIGVFNFVEVGDTVVRAKVYDAASMLVEEIRFTVDPWAWTQKHISAPVTNGLIVWEIERGVLYMWAVSVDNRSNTGTLLWPVWPLK